MLKIFRVFLGGYTPDYEKLSEMGYAVIKLPRPLITILNTNQGFGQIKGTVKKVGNTYAAVNVCCFKRSNRQLLWEIKSKVDGTYGFRNIAKDLECFVIAFDPNNQYNAVIQDKLVAK